MLFRSSALRGLVAIGARHASGLSLAAARELPVQEKVVLFTRSACPFCRDLLERLDDAGVAARVVPLEHGPDDAVRADLKERT